MPSPKTANGLGLSTNPFIKVLIVLATITVHIINANKIQNLFFSSFLKIIKETRTIIIKLGLKPLASKNDILDILDGEDGKKPQERLQTINNQILHEVQNNKK